MTDDLQVIRDALASGPTPGPWIDDRHSTWVYPMTTVETANAGLVEQGYRTRVMDMRLSDLGSFSCTTGKAEQEWTNAAYIAACSPDRIARLLKRLEDAERIASRGEYPIDWAM